MLLCLGIFVYAQSYNNEWIEYSKTYYKFTVGKTGLYRISQSVLSSVGLANTPAEQFQLWRNGQQVMIYTSVASGPLPAGGYIEFWGEKNDGKPDKDLYKNPANQLSDALSLETDTAAFFLTVNAAANLRATDAVNDVSNNTLSPEAYFIHHYRYDYKDRANLGKAVNFGELVYSSTYDVGEFLASNDVYPGSPLQLSAGNLYVAANGPFATLKVSIAGNSFLGGNRSITASINGTNVISSTLYNMAAQIFSNTAVSLSLLNTTATNFSFSNNAGSTNDRIAVGFVDLEYPRLFNFGGVANFQFSLPATTTGNYLEISNFLYTAAPVLYDLTNGKRYVANTAVTGLLKFALPASGVDRNFVLVSEDAANINNIGSLTTRSFINYATAGNQGNYLIISNKRLFTNGNPVEAYRVYRTTAAGGSYNAKVIDIDELIDQFAFGIKKHPLSVKNFLRYARNNFSTPPEFAFLIGKAVTYNEYRFNQSSMNDDVLDLVPTFGWPASDNLLASDDLNPVPATHIGRLAAIAPEEVQVYLDKIKLYEQQQQSSSQTIADKAWMKEMVHVTGANDLSLDGVLTAHLNYYKSIIEAPSFGANVFSFNRTATGAQNPQTDALMTGLFNNGISLINYFGHSAATQLDYNLNSPDQFNNYGKYPVFLVNGCNAGNIYSYDTSRLNLITSLSEKFVFAKDRGSIAFIASTHFGVESYLNGYNIGFYNSLASTGYNQPVSVNMKDATMALLNYPGDSTTKYLHAEENVLHGDPALKINAFAKPDFVVEDPQVIISPSFITVANNTFNVKVYFYNIGKALSDSVSILLTRKYPAGNSVTLISKKIPSVRYVDSVELTITLDPSKDVGQNSITVTIDNDLKYDELSELNNTVTKTFFIIEDELKPVYPYNFAIVNKSDTKLVASTANALATPRQYVMEMDTTELFNSSLKQSQTTTAPGGIVEFTPAISFTDSTVYYWRVAPVPSDGNYSWNTSSFVYLPGSSFGYNQSHLYQHLKSSFERISLDSFSRKWNFDERLSSFLIYNAVFPISGTQPSEFSVLINGQFISASACVGHSVIFNVFDPVTLQPLYNQAVPSTTGSGVYGGFMGSGGTCNDNDKSGTQFNFEFSYLDTTGRRKMRDFMDWIPAGYIVSSRLILDAPYDQVLVQQWKNDQTVYGVGNTAYDRFIAAGFSGFDQFSYPRTWSYVYKKNDATFTTQWKLTEGLSDALTLQLNIATPDTLGYITSPVFGPAAAWKQVKWRGVTPDTKAGDAATVDVIGVSPSGIETVLYTLNTTQQDFDISSVSVSNYPYIKLKMRNADSINLTPYQLRYWRLLYDPVPEGALAANIYYSFKDTLSVGETSTFSIAFKNVSDASFADSIAVKLNVTDANNVTSILNPNKLVQLKPGETDTVTYTFDSKNYSGVNSLFLDVNPDNTQPEQYHFNNFLYQNFLVRYDNYKPVMDVTFDGIHILNNDIVASLPHILIKVKDESKYLLLDDTSLVKVQLQYPDGTIKRYYFSSDTLRFTPATAASADNTAQVDFTPYLPDDGTYILYIHAQDKTGNPAGNVDYSVSFQVYNKPMITNLFNYPNPFTSSTAFVFTVTGSVVPQNIRIQILTITGKIVKEITKDELGPLHIGRNITDYKWDGTDMYGQKLANGVYLYRVITNLNGNHLDKFPTYDANGNQVDTDKYFNRGYGKMYLMR
ncbi:MAG TPA: C25 family cysteine peptidase [Chitinophagaceae bacterium]|nr:C25 family cysteine peptidase [Chitinophagaceae bacterium]